MYKNSVYNKKGTIQEKNVIALVITNLGMRKGVEYGEYGIRN